MEYLVIALLIVIMAVLIGFSRMQKLTFQKYDKSPGTEDILGNFCPLCGSGLKKGERVKSAAYPAKPGSDGRYPGGVEKLMEVYGCPHCIPPGGSEKRICPVCKKEVPENGYVMGRYFIVNNTEQRPDGSFARRKNHLHVLGCTGCRRV